MESSSSPSPGVSTHKDVRQLHCQAVVMRVGEIFAEFGIEFNNGSVTEEDLEGIERWRLVVYASEPARVVELSEAAGAAEQDEFVPPAETDPLLLCDELVDAPRARKVVKLAAGSQYVAGVQYYHKPSCSWSTWSAPVRAATFHPVIGRIDDIGEDWVRVQWERTAVRDTTGMTPEVDAVGTRRIGDIAGFELRVLRERDMVQEFCQGFESGVRSHTLRGLSPGTAYVVMMRHETLIGTVINWVPVGRFYTEAALHVSLESRGEDTISVTWQRGTERPSSAIGYVLPHIDAHQYEVTIESDGLYFAPTELPASVTSHRIVDLFPSTTYAIYVRCFSKEGIWGTRSNRLDVRTVDRPTVSATCVCECFLSFTWNRPTEEASESKLEYKVESPATGFKQRKLLDVYRNTADTDKDGGEDENEDMTASHRQFHLEGLAAGTEYLVSMRSFVGGEWGLWTTPTAFTTRPKAVLTCVERGEDFFTLKWPTPGGVNADPHPDDCYNVMVTQLSALGERIVLLDKEVRPELGQPGFRVNHLPADSLFEVTSRTRQHNPVTGAEQWGEFSTPLRLQTLEPVSLHVWDLGEDFAHIVWKRGLGTNEDDANLKDKNNKESSSSRWGALTYEVVVACVDTDEDNILHCHVLEANYMITNLRPSTTYMISVRAGDDRGQWGLWSKIRVRTLASVVTAIHEIGEDFVRLMWQRHTMDDDNDPGLGVTGNSDTSTSNNNNNTAAATADNAVTTADMFISRYSIFVYSTEMLEGNVVPDEESGYFAGGRADVCRRLIVSSEHTSLRVAELLPDREYVAVVRASTASGKWGLWSRPAHFRTNPQFCIPVNNLSIGENYVNLIWGRDTQPILSDPDVQLGDMTVTGQQLRIQGVDTQYFKDHTLDADLRELKLYGLSPASAYTIQLRVCGRSGCWGLWSPPVHILTRGTILTRAIEVAEDYAVINWERRRVPNPSHYPTGRGVVTSYHLRVYNNTTGVHLETFLSDSDCPYRISGLRSDTYYCVELKAHYNDEEWGLWSTPLWCLTMRPMKLQTRLISEEFCRLSINRPEQQRRLPEDDGNRPTEDKMVAFGQLRSNLMLCVTSPILTKTAHSPSGQAKPKYHNSSLPPDAADHRLVYQTEIISSTEVTEHTVPNLKSNTVYSVSARSKLANGEWGMWAPSMLFATVPTTCVAFMDIGENFIDVEWRRHVQLIPPQIEEPERVVCGLGTISASRVRVREVGGSYQRLYSIESSFKTLRLEDLAPATTYGVSVQTYNDNFDWGVWSEESKVRTVPGMGINIQHVSEDALWVSWTRLTDLDAITDADTTLSVNVIAKACEVRITGAGGFQYSKETDSNKLFFRGLQPDTVYTVGVRVLFAETGEWGLWSLCAFRTKPRLRVTFGSIGEHFAIVEWRRHLPKHSSEEELEVEASAVVAETDDVVQRFRFKVQRVGDDVAHLYDLSPTVSSFRLRNLLPSSEYRVWMCAKGYEGVWGFWNEETRVRTLPKLQLDVVDIGEDYVRVNWQRGAWQGEFVPPNEDEDEEDVEVRQVDGAVSGYQVRVLDRYGAVVSTQAVSFRETRCVVSGLNLSSLYSVEVCAKDTYEEWGLWSDVRRFVTLKAVSMNLQRVGETFMDVEWHRLGQQYNNMRAKNRRRRLASVDGDEEYYEEEEENEMTNYGDATAPLDSDTFGGYHHSGQHSSQHCDVLEESFPSDALREDEGATQWHVRVQAKRIFGGQPEAEDYREFYTDANEFSRRIGELLPNSTYAVSVRARNKADEWGHWSPLMLVATYPLLQVHVDAVGETFISLSWERGQRAESGAAVTDASSAAAFGAPLGGGDEGITTVPTTELVHGDSLVCFPESADIHNYQVMIRPLASEAAQFDEADEPLVDGARAYETTQPSLRLGNLTPGTRYVATVREQHVDDSGRAINGSWGAESEPMFLETIPPLRVIPVEIGEDYCLVEWRRVHRVAEESNTQLAVSTSAPRVSEYEVNILRLQDDGVTEYEGAFALNKRVSLQPNVQSYHIHSLVHNTIYEVRVRGRSDSGSWGPWSPVTKFVTNGRLLVTVESVFETNAVVSWARPLPTWAAKMQHPHEAICEDPRPCSAVSDDMVATERTVGVATLPRCSDAGGAVLGAVATSPGEDDGIDLAPLREVLLGDYSVQKYELIVKGISCDFDQTMTIGKEEMSVAVTGLQQHHMYWICVRSCSENGHWSKHSNKHTILTLCPMRAAVAHYTESVAVVRWHREVSDVNDFAEVLATERAAAERRCDERERRDLFQLKRLMQEMEAAESTGDFVLTGGVDDGEMGPGVSNMSGVMIAGEGGWVDKTTRDEHNALLRLQATQHLWPEKVVLGDSEATAYHFRLFGNEDGEQAADIEESNDGSVRTAAQAKEMTCCPYIQGVDALRVRNVGPVAGVGVGHLAKLLETLSVNSGGLGGTNSGGAGAGSVAGKRATKKAMTVASASMYNGSEAPGTSITPIHGRDNSALSGGAGGYAAFDETAALSEGAVIDVQLQDIVHEVVIRNLSPSTTFRLTVCARNTREEWQPWSESVLLHTLAPITLSQSRFGEHYINLFWHRMDAATAATMDRQQGEYLALSEEFKDFTQKDLEARRAEVSAEEYTALVERLRQWRDAKLAVQERRQSLVDGKVPLTVDPNTSILGYQLRIVLESGKFVEHYIALDAADAGGAAFTATGLKPNSMYVCLVCADYGHGIWGQWTKPLKFMTQNLIQLQLTYVGEAFVDIAWQRLENKKLSAIDRADTLLTSTFTEEEQIYQVRITHSDPVTGESIEEQREMKTCNSFRIDSLNPDTKYTFAVREWDAKGDWGLWCTPRTCATLPGMFSVIADVGDNWASIQWGRLMRRVDYDNDMHVLQYGVDAISCYLRVQELSDNGDDHNSSAADGSVVEEVDGGFLEGDGDAATDGQSGSGARSRSSVVRSDRVSPSSTVNVFSADEMEGIFADTQRRTQSNLPREHPKEFEGTREDGRYVLVKRFDPSVELFDIRTLRPDRFYSVEVLSETTGGQLGMWSAAQLLLTMPKINLSVNYIDEQYVDIEWVRHPPRQHPRLNMADVFVGEYVTLSYELEVTSVADDRQSSTSGTGAIGRLAPGTVAQAAAPFALSTVLQASVSSYYVKGLKLDSIYAARIRSVNAKHQTSLWSDTLRMATLTPVLVRPVQIIEDCISLVWGRDEQCTMEMGRAVQAELEEEATAAAAAAADNSASTSAPSGTVVEAMTTTAAVATATSPASSAVPVVHIGSKESAGYQMRVSCAKSHGIEPLMEKNFNGNVHSLELASLQPNTAYVITVRAANARGEWGLWSEERCVYTMKLVSATVGAVGEDFVRLMWERPAPDEVQQVIQTASSISMPSPSAGAALQCSAVSGSSPNSPTAMPRDEADFTAISNNGVAVSANASNIANAAAGAPGVGDDSATEDPTRPRQLRARRFPLLDHPEEVHPVYRSEHTEIKTIAISVRREDESEGYTVEVDGNMHCHTIPSLRADTVYYIAVRACYGNGEWGPWSSAVQTGTYNLLAVELKDLGEDFFAAVWQRKSNTAGLQSLLLGKVEETTCYELAVHDFTDVPFGEEGEAALEPRELRSFFIQPKQRNYTVKDLHSNHRYRLSVRRWYKPLEKFLKDCPQVQPATDDGQIRETIERTRAVPGAWSEPDYAVTLRDMICVAEKIGEDFFCVHWERDPRAVSLPIRKNFAVKPTQNYQVRIDELLRDGTAVDTSNDSYHVDKLISPTENTFLAQGLRPDSVYRVDVRCSVEKVWGRWSRSVYLITLPKLHIEVTNIGEDSASISWRRHFRPLMLPDGSEADTGDKNTNDTYQLDINGIGIPFQLSKRFKGSRTSYTAKHLEAKALYSIQVRSSDSIRQTWSLWSELVYFATLPPLQVTVGPPAEHFVYVNWQRPTQTSEDYAELLDQHNQQDQQQRQKRAIVFGDPSVMAYHLCAFNTESTPSLAVADKQFPSDTTRYRLSALSPDNSYIVIVRACNAVGQWGLWSEERSLRTPRLPVMNIMNIGENYANLSWDRDEGDRENDIMRPVSYVVVLKSQEGTAERTLAPSECRVSEEEGVKVRYYCIDGLTAGTEYLLAVQACYGEPDWGLWSKAVHCCTLNPVAVSVEIFHDRAELTWGRRGNVVDNSAGDAIASPDTVPPPTAELRVPKRPTSGGVPSASPATARIVSASGTIRGASADANNKSNSSIPAAAAAADDKDSVMPLEVGTVKRYQLVACKAEDIASIFTPPASTLNGGNGMVDKRIPDRAHSPDEDTDTAIPDMEVLSNTAAAEVKFKIETEIECEDLHDRDVHFSMDKLEMDTTYVVRVRALDANGEWGAWSEHIIDTPPYPPTGAVLRKVNAQYCSLQWNPPRSMRQDARYRYVVEQHYVNPDNIPSGGRSVSALAGGMRRATTGNILYDWRVVDTVEATVCPIRILGPITRLRCRVKCCRRPDLQGPTAVLPGTNAIALPSPYSDFSGIVSLSTGTPPEPVSQLAVTALSRSAAILEWLPPPQMRNLAALTGASTSVAAPLAGGAAAADGLSGASRLTLTTFRVYLAHKDHSAILLTTTHHTTHTVEDLSSSTDYTVQVVAENADGISYNSPMIRFHTKPESDLTLTHHEPGSAPLGVLVDPNAARDEAKDRGGMADIPGASSLRTPAPPSRMGALGKNGRGRPGALQMSVAADGSLLTAALAAEQRRRSYLMKHSPRARVHGTLRSSSAKRKRGGSKKRKGSAKRKKKRSTSSRSKRRRSRSRSRSRSQNSSSGRSSRGPEPRRDTSIGVVLPPLSRTM